MSSPIKEVHQALAIFMSGGDYDSFWEVVSEAADAFDDDDAISDDDREWFDELYDAVYMGAEDPIDAKSAKEGMVGAAELRNQIREMALER